MPPVFRGLVRAPEGRAGDAGGSLSRRLEGLGEPERERLLLDLVLGEAAGSLGHANPERIDPDRAFKEIGFDSLAAVELRNRLLALTGLRLPSTVVFDQPNVRALAGHLADRLAGGEPARSPVEPAGNHRDLESASDEEVIRLIEAEFGSI